MQTFPIYWCCRLSLFNSSYKKTLLAKVDRYQPGIKLSMLKA